QVHERRIRVLPSEQIVEESAQIGARQGGIVVVSPADMIGRIPNRRGPVEKGPGKRRSAECEESGRDEEIFTPPPFDGHCRGLRSIPLPTGNAAASCGSST